MNQDRACENSDPQLRRRDQQSSFQNLPIFFTPLRAPLTETATRPAKTRKKSANPFREDAFRSRWISFAEMVERNTRSL